MDHFNTIYIFFCGRFPSIVDLGHKKVHSTALLKYIKEVCLYQGCIANNLQSLFVGNGLVY